MRIICLCGVDGSGKSTLADRLSDYLSCEKEEYQSVWMGWKEFRSPPFKQIAWSVKRFSSPYLTNDNEYLTGSTDNKLLNTRFYLAVILLDHIIFMYYKYIMSVIKGKNLVLDRYYFDIVASFAANTGAQISDFTTLLKVLQLVYPTPTDVLIIDVPVEVSLERKEDIPSEDFIGKRRERYIEYVQSFDYNMIDNSGDVEDTIELIITNLKSQGNNQ